MEPWDPNAPGGEERYPIHAPGWSALDAVLGARYPGQTPHQFASKTGYDLESRAPLPAIAVYAGEDPTHWHYVTYGLTELFEKSSPVADVSGFGFELTLRLAREAGQERPPTWALELLQGVGGHILRGHAPLDTGHVIDLGGPLHPSLETSLTALVTVPDPGLGKLPTPHGSVLFLQLFGLGADEAEQIGQWDLQRKVGLVTDVDPLAITRPGRLPFSEDRRTAAIFRRYALKILI